MGTGFMLTDENASAVARICRRLDGIPLAIEIAAAHSAALSPSEIIAQLDDLLSHRSESPAVHRRWQIMWDALDCSYNRLSEPARELLLRVSVFDGAWDLSAAETVCCDASLAHTEVLDALSSLVEKSLLIAETSRDATLYRLLCTTRAYVRGRSERTRDWH
ncbi:MAG: hypothetical protein JOY59_03740 [Candidatus Eremiobacteraeota bacterium]|nr:hypothetical protein [Candidatus Eremiobacteraeota bacterium]